MKAVLLALSLIPFYAHSAPLEIKTYFCKKIKTLSTGGTYMNFWCYMENGQVSPMFQTPLENDVNGPITYNNDTNSLIQKGIHRASEESRASTLVSLASSFNMIKQVNPNSNMKMRVQTRKSNVNPDKEIIHNLSLEE